MIEHHLFEFAKAYHHLCGHCDQLMGAEFKECTTIISEQRRGFVIQHALSPLIAELEHLNLNPDVTQSERIQGETRTAWGQVDGRTTAE